MKFSIKGRWGRVEAQFLLLLTKLFKLRLGALIPTSVCRSVCLSFCRSGCPSSKNYKKLQNFTKLYKTLQNFTKHWKTVKEAPALLS